MQDLWDVFFTTGKISDYLAFRDSLADEDGKDREFGSGIEKEQASAPDEGKREAWERTW